MSSETAILDRVSLAVSRSFESLFFKALQTQVMSLGNFDSKIETGSFWNSFISAKTTLERRLLFLEPCLSTFSLIKNDSTFGIILLFNDLHTLRWVESNTTE